MNVNIEYYKTFLAVARYKNLTKAAAFLSVSQPAVTKTINQLESQLGGKLFIRSRIGMELTPEGKELFIKVNAAMNILKDVENDFSKKANLEGGEVRIGISTILTKIFLLPFISAFKEKYPKVKINIQNGLTTDLLYQLKKGSLDIVIYNDKIENSNILEQKVLEKINYSLIYNKDVYDIKNLKDCKNLPFIVQKEGSRARNIFDNFAKKNKLNPNISLEVTSHELGYEFVKQGLGIGFTYSKIIKDDFIKSVPVPADINSEIIIATNKNIVKTNATKAFCNILEKE